MTSNLIKKTSWRFYYNNTNMKYLHFKKGKNINTINKISQQKAFLRRKSTNFYYQTFFVNIRINNLIINNLGYDV